MHHAAAMDRAQRGRGAAAERERLGDSELRALQAGRQRLARQPLHHEVGVALGRDPVVDVTHDPGV